MALIEKILRLNFGHPATPVFALVATLGQFSPALCTMRLWDSALRTQKCFDILLHPSVALLFFHPNVGKLSLQGTASRVSKDDNAPFLQNYWQGLSDEVKVIYAILPLHFAPFRLNIHKFEWLKLHTDYILSKRIFYSKNKEKWLKKAIPISS